MTASLERRLEILEGRKRARECRLSFAVLAPHADGTMPQGSHGVAIVVPPKQTSEGWTS